MNHKAKGARAERRAKSILEARGYDLILKSAGSLGLFDLVALSVDHDHALLVQVKCRSPGRAEMDRMISYQVPDYCRKQLWIFRDREQEPKIIEL